MLVPGTRFLIGAVGYVITCWDLEIGAERWQHHDDTGGKYPKLAVSPDSRWLVVGFHDSGLWSLRDIETGALRHQGGGNVGTQRVDWSADSSRFFTLAFTHRKNLTAWNAETGAELRTLTAGKSSTSALSISGDSTLVAVGDSSGFITLYDAQKLRKIRQIRAQKNSKEIENIICHLAFSPDSRHLLITYINGTALILKVADDTTQAVNPHTGQVRAGAWLADGTRVVTVNCGGSRLVKIWDPYTGNTLHQWETTQPLESAIEENGDFDTWSLSWSTDGGFLALGHVSGDVSLWDTRGI